MERKETRGKQTDSRSSPGLGARVRPGSVIRRLVLLLLVTAASCLLTSVWSPLATSVSAQKVIDKMVATVNAGLIPDCGEVCLITYSDLLWQLALQPDAPLDNPSSDQLNRALRLVIDQRLILQEAEKLPSIEPTLEETRAARDELATLFSRGEFEARLQRVGLTASKFSEIIEQRLKIEKYLDFRFRNFVVITQQEVADYYRDVYAPRFRTRGQIVPSLEDARADIEKLLTESKVESDTDAFLDNARDRAEIVMLNPV